MKRVTPRLDKHGFPIPPGFDDPLDDASSPRSSGTRRLFPLLKLTVLIGVAAALWVHFDVGTKGRDLFARYHGQKAVDWANRGDFDHALAEADQAVEWNPNSGALLLLRSRIQFKRKDYARMLADAQAAIAVKPNDEEARQVQGTALFYLGRHAEAAAAATELLERQLGDRIEALNTRAYARALGGFELNEALADIDEALADSPDNPMYVDTRGYVLFKLGRYDEALKDLNRAIKQIEERRDQIEQALQFKGQPAQANDAIARQMKEFEHHLAVMHHHRGEVHEKLGNAEEAKRDLFIGDQLGFNPAEGVY